MNNSIEPSLIGQIIYYFFTLASIAIIFLVFKLYFLITKYLKVKTKYLESKINE
ncbi:hypothetical protein TAMYLO_740007 [Tenacibaculum amylolyticum]